MINVGLVGARGYVGRELITELDQDQRFDLVFASSRAMAGKPLSSAVGPNALGRFGNLEAENLSPKDVAGREADIIILGLPNGLATPVVQALDAASFKGQIIDLSADYRYNDSWVYGSPELNGEAVKGAHRIANPGCYATAANLGLAPLQSRAAGPASVFGLSGYSGAGTTPSSKNDPERLEANALPYGFGGHGHEREIEAVTGQEVIFAPHVAPFFRGLLCTMTVPLAEEADAAAIKLLFDQFYADHPLVTIMTEPPEIKSVAGQNHCAIGGFAVSHGGRLLTFTSALDNLRKGAATQALENLILSRGL